MKNQVLPDEAKEAMKAGATLVYTTPVEGVWILAHDGIERYFEAVRS